MVHEGADLGIADALDLVGVVTNAGGPGILLADAREARGLELPPLAPGTLGALHAFLPVHAGFANPIDLTASGTPEQYRSSERGQVSNLMLCWLSLGDELAVVEGSRR